jgi:hypothetical protein
MQRSHSVPRIVRGLDAGHHHCHHRFAFRRAQAPRVGSQSRTVDAHLPWRDENNEGRKEERSGAGRKIWLSFRLDASGSWQGHFRTGVIRQDIDREDRSSVSGPKVISSGNHCGTQTCGKEAVRLARV